MRGGNATFIGFPDKGSLRRRTRLPLFSPIAVALAASCAGAPAPASANSPQRERTEQNTEQPDDGVAQPTRATSSSPTRASGETRTTQVIQGVIQHNRKSIRSCYDAELQRQPGLRGTLTLHFTIGPKGDVKSASVNAERSTLSQGPLTQCAIAALKRIQFPKSSRGFESTVNYPFDFKP